jgi:hypothetical protein
VTGNRIKIGNIGVVFQFLVNVPEGWRGLNASTNGKAESMGLIGSMVRILPNNYELGVGKETKIQRGKGIFGGWVDLLPLPTYSKRE